MSHGTILFGQQVFVVVNGEQVRGTISKIDKGDDGEYVYHVSWSKRPPRATVRSEKRRLRQGSNSEVNTAAFDPALFLLPAYLRGQDAV